MKKILILSALAAVLGFSSCSETWDDNPVLKTHTGEIKADFLNNPVLQDQVIMITNDNKEGTFHLTCSQPDYGYAAVATYKVQCSLTEDFANYEEIAQSFYDCSEINPVNADVAAAIEYLSGVKSEEDLPLPYQKLYMRLKAYVAQSESNTVYISNPVAFKGVSADYLAIWVEGVPSAMYLRGEMNDWNAPDEYRFVTGPDKDTWIIPTVTLAAGTQFKVADATWGSINMGAGSSADIKPGERFALNAGENPGNIKLTEDFTGLVHLNLEAGIYYLTLDPAH